MRAAPVGLAHCLGPSSVWLVEDAVLSCVPTHTHPVGVAGAVTIAAAVAWCTRTRLAGSESIDVGALLDFLCAGGKTIITGTMKRTYSRLPTPCGTSIRRL
jgi:ADP-ribosylglycohydrolase